MKRTATTLLLSVLLALPVSAQTSSNIPERKAVLTERQIVENIESYIEEIRQDWKVPGMGVSMYKDGKMLLLKGYGAKNLDNPDDKVDEHTVFQIGSVSKSFTAAVIAQLVDEGLVSWTDPVIKYLPDFKMYDPWVTEHIQIRDLTTHRTGLLGQMGTYLPNLGYSGEDIMKMMALMEPDYSFRGGYQYNNITFIPAAMIIEKVTGKSWQDNIRERIFEPLGMTDSSIGGEEFAKALADGKAALPYEFKRKGAEMQLTPLHGEEQALWWLSVIGPAGALNCSAADLSKWAQFHLHNGKVGDRQIISEKQMNYLHRGLNPISQGSDMIKMYAHCWFVEQTRKGLIFWHTGSTWGMTSICSFIPELDLCITVNVNSEAPNAVRESIVRRAVDLFLGYEDYDYSRKSLDTWYSNARKSAGKEAAATAPEIKPAPDNSLILGTYTKSEPFGDIEISLEKGTRIKGKKKAWTEDKLYLTLFNGKGWKHELKHVNGNVYNFRSDGYGFNVTFIFPDEDNTGPAEGLKLNFGGGEKFGPWTKVQAGL